MYVCMYVCICAMCTRVTWLDHEDIGSFRLVQSSLNQCFSAIGGILLFTHNIHTVHTCIHTLCNNDILCYHRLKS